MKSRTRDNSSDVALVVAWRARMFKMPIRSPALPSRGGINILIIEHFDSSYHDSSLMYSFLKVHP